MKLAIVTSHPIQYYAPVFSFLTIGSGLNLKVFYTWEKNASTFDEDFEKEIEWDIPLLEGYKYKFVSNKNKMGKSFWDVKNPELINDIKEWKADAVLVIGWNYFSHLNAMMHFKDRIPVLFRGDSTLLDEKPGVKMLLRRIFLRFIYRNIDIALYVGSANKAYYKSHGIKENQLIFSPHAIDNARFFTVSIEQEAFISKTRESFGITEADITIVFCGKLQPKKDPLILIRAIKKLDFMNIHLIIVGDGKLSEEVKKEIKGYSKIHILPFQNQSMMPAVYRLGEIFCLPSCGPAETWGLAVNEAMASGRAVLVSDKAGCHPDLVIDGINGYSFHSNDISDLQDKINKMIGSRDRLSQMGKASKQIISTWNFDAIVSSIKKSLRSI